MGFHGFVIGIALKNYGALVCLDVQICTTSTGN
jgi:hypothetical protein